MTIAYRKLFHVLQFDLSLRFLFSRKFRKGSTCVIMVRHENGWWSPIGRLTVLILMLIVLKILDNFLYFFAVFFLLR